MTTLIKILKILYYRFFNEFLTWIKIRFQFSNTKDKSIPHFLFSFTLNFEMITENEITYIYFLYYLLNLISFIFCKDRRKKMALYLWARNSLKIHKNLNGQAGIF